MEITKEEIIFRLVQEGKITMEEFIVLVKEIKFQEVKNKDWYIKTTYPGAAIVPYNVNDNYTKK